MTCVDGLQNLDRSPTRHVLEHPFDIAVRTLDAQEQTVCPHRPRDLAAAASSKNDGTLAANRAIRRVVRAAEASRSSRPSPVRDAPADFAAATAFFATLGRRQ